MGGLIGTATSEKDGLMSAYYLKTGFNLQYRAVGLYKIISSQELWRRAYAAVIGSIDEIPYFALLGYYRTDKGTNNQLKIITGNNSFFEFYMKDNEAYLHLNGNESSPRSFSILSSSGISYIGFVEPDSTYIKITNS